MLAQDNQLLGPPRRTGSVHHAALGPHTLLSTMVPRARMLVSRALLASTSAPMPLSAVIANVTHATLDNSRQVLATLRAFCGARVPLELGNSHRDLRALIVNASNAPWARAFRRTTLVVSARLSVSPVLQGGTRAYLLLQRPTASAVLVLLASLKRSLVTTSAKTGDAAHLDLAWSPPDLPHRILCALHACPGPLFRACTTQANASPLAKSVLLASTSVQWPLPRATGSAKLAHRGSLRTTRPIVRVVNGGSAQLVRGRLSLAPMSQTANAHPASLDLRSQLPMTATRASTSVHRVQLALSWTSPLLPRMTFRAPHVLMANSRLEPAAERAPRGPHASQARACRPRAAPLPTASAPRACRARRSPPRTAARNAPL